MTACISCEERFIRTSDGRVWSNATASYSFWKRYLSVFDQVRVVSRVAAAPAPGSYSQRADGEGVKFDALPCYVGPVGYARHFFSMTGVIRTVLSRADAVIMRVASPIAVVVGQQLPRDRPFALELVGDPYEAFGPGGIDHPLRPILRWWLTRQLQNQCQTACAVAYVTSGALQRRYPVNNDAFSTTYSSIELNDDAFAAGPRGFTTHFAPFRVIGVGTLEVPYKGFDVLIDAVSDCRKQGLAAELVLVGDGRRRAELESHACSSGIEQYVRFTGQLRGGAHVREELDQADLFVMPSRTEGLPRAMIEAMARGLPCIGSAVGGIPELLDAENLVPPGSAPALARKIREVLTDSDRMRMMSAANLAKAREYHDSALAVRRREFLVHVREATHQWARNGKSHQQ